TMTAGDGRGLDSARPLVRRPRSRLGIGQGGGRAIVVAAFSTVVVFGAAGLVVVNAPGWPQVQEKFLNGRVFVESFPLIVGAFWVNVRLFLIAETLILVLALGVAVMRGVPGPVFFPVRLLATIYVDVFRALPGILVIFLFGLGIPALRIEGVPNDPFVWAVVALTLLYTAYVSEVYRAGIESVHPSQEAAARSLGLTQAQALRYVILPQAVRRVIPPLLNDFIGLQKDTALVSFVGVVEIFRQSQIRQAGAFNFTPYLVTALVFLVVTIPLARAVDWLARREPGGGAGATASTGRA
ncbi:MAG TPA: amino acid ABC transporter permease, partial [Candidatus Limnocylindrales bacterium]|nr:amino acid ABC transporter permease [Candidatus Limnocylindrales bacterium]